jgi:Domain of unknown function (DUF4190)
MRRRDDDYPDEDDDYPEDRPRRRAPDIGQDAGIRMLLPVGRSGWAIASGYLGLISVLLIPAPFALLTGILAMLEIGRNPKKHGMGRAVFGIVMGGIFSIPLVILLVGLALEAIK